MGDPQVSFLGEQALTRRTWAAPSGWSGGTFSKGSAAETPITGVWRPADADTFQLLTDGERKKSPKKLYTTSTLQTISQYDGDTPDWVSPDGGTTWWQVTDYGQNNFSLPADPLAHNKYILLRVQEPNG